MSKMAQWADAIELAIPVLENERTKHRTCAMFYVGNTDVIELLKDLVKRLRIWSGKDEDKGQ